MIPSALFLPSSRFPIEISWSPLRPTRHSYAKDQERAFEKVYEPYWATFHKRELCESMNTVTAALITAILGILGLFITSALERRRALRLRELEFRLDRYKEFLQALSEYGANPTFATQLRFTNSLNVILLIGSTGLLQAVKNLVDNYNDQNGSWEKQIPILNRIMLGMRRDLNDAESKHLTEFDFPIIFPDIPPGTKTPSAKSAKAIKKRA